MPQGYIVARCPAAATVSSPVAVSRSLTSTPLPGRSGTPAARHASIVARLQVSCPTISDPPLYHEYFDRKYEIGAAGRVKPATRFALVEVVPAALPDVVDGVADVTLAVHGLLLRDVAEHLNAEAAVQVVRDPLLPRPPDDLRGQSADGPRLGHDVVRDRECPRDQFTARQQCDRLQQGTNPGRARNPGQGRGASFWPCGTQGRWRRGHGGHKAAKRCGTGAHEVSEVR